MSIPVLTPLDTPIFDDDVILEMEERIDDVLLCSTRGCEREATVLIRQRCCGTRCVFCAQHRDVAKHAVETSLVLGGLMCLVCGTQFVIPAAVCWHDVVTEVPL